jgi:hypothetical protein
VQFDTSSASWVSRTLSAPGALETQALTSSKPKLTAVSRRMKGMAYLEG